MQTCSKNVGKKPNSKLLVHIYHSRRRTPDQRSRVPPAPPRLKTALTLGQLFLVRDRTCHQYVGNIIAALVATAVLSREGVSYYWALIIPAAANATWGFVIYMFLPPHPEEIGLESPKDTEKVSKTPGGALETWESRFLTLCRGKNCRRRRSACVRLCPRGSIRMFGVQEWRHGRKSCDPDGAGVLVHREGVLQRYSSDRRSNVKLIR